MFYLKFIFAVPFALPRLLLGPWSLLHANFAPRQGSKKYAENKMWKNILAQDGEQKGFVGTSTFQSRVEKYLK